MSYRVFKRAWWKKNPAWPNGLEPNPGARKRLICYAETEAEARKICKEYNRENDPGPLSIKAEFESV